jgi:hypothetical protein
MRVVEFALAIPRVICRRRERAHPVTTTLIVRGDARIGGVRPWPAGGQHVRHEEECRVREADANRQVGGAPPGLSPLEGGATRCGVLTRWNVHVPFNCAARAPVRVHFSRTSALTQGRAASAAEAGRASRMPVSTCCGGVGLQARALSTYECARTPAQAAVPRARLGAVSHKRARWREFATVL